MGPPRQQTTGPEAADHLALLLPKASDQVVPITISPASCPPTTLQLPHCLPLSRSGHSLGCGNPHPFPALH